MHLSQWFPHSIFVFAGFATAALAQAAAEDAKIGANAPSMTLTSPAFADGASIPAKYTRSGDDVSPPLAWANPPPGTKSFIIHVHDVDTPQQYKKSNPTRVHWLVWNIPATAREMPEAVASGSPRPDGSRQTSFAGPLYFGPGIDQRDGASPPHPNPIVHRYRFEVWALDIMLEVQPEADALETRGKVVLAMNGHVLGRAIYTGHFSSAE